MKQAQRKHTIGWYYRKQGVVKGPFPKRMISNFVLLGRLKLQDLVSVDREHWSRIIDNRELIPKEMLSVKTAADKERLLLARRREDERRRHPDAHGGTDKRRAERRQGEDQALARGRQFRNGLSSGTTKEKSYRLRLAGLLLVIGVGIGIAVYHGLHDDLQQGPAVDCNTPPAPKLNWSNCTLEGRKAALKNLSGALIKNANLAGADFHGANLSNAVLDYTNLSTANLSYADLSGASLVGSGLRNADLTYTRLTGADLSYANLRGARIGGAQLKGAKLDRAIWIDGTLCALGSVGVCRK